MTISSVTYDIDDFNAIASHWLQSVTSGTSGDISSDGTVNTKDLGIVMEELNVR